MKTNLVGFDNKKKVMIVKNNYYTEKRKYSKIIIINYLKYIYLALKFIFNS